jgi:hypothetical protein
MANRTKDEQLLILGLVHVIPIDAFNNITDNTTLDVDKLCDDLEYHFRKNHNIEDADNDAFISSVRDNQAEPVEDTSIPMWKFQGYASEAEWTAQEYARNRKAEYNALNQFELISDDDVNGTTTHKDAIAAIKAKYPKPE